MRYTHEEMELALTELTKNAKPMHGFVAALFACIPTAALCYVISTMAAIPLVVLIIPPLIIGLTARFVGRTYRIKHRLPIGIIGAAMYLLYWGVLQLNPAFTLLLPIAFYISFFTAKIKLKPVDIWALEEQELGAFDTKTASNSNNNLMTKDEFTAAVIKHLQQENPNIAIEATEQLKIHTKEPYHGWQKMYDLTNLYIDYSSQKKSFDDISMSIKTGYAEALASMNNQQIQNILPVIKSVHYIKETAEQLKFANIDENNFPIYYEKLNDDLIKIYAFDTETTSRPINRKEINDLGIADSIEFTAKQNIFNYYNENNARIEELDLEDNGKIYIFSADDTYEASVITAFDYLEASVLDTKHQWVVFVPARNVVLITSAEYPQAINMAATMAEQTYDGAAYPLSPYGYTRCNEQWVRYIGQSSH